MGVCVCHSPACQSAGVGKESGVPEVCSCMLGSWLASTVAVRLQAEIALRGWENAFPMLTYQLEGEMQAHKFPLACWKDFL